MKALSKATRILARIFEIGHWVAAGIMLVLLITAIAFPAQMNEMITGDITAEESMYGFHITLAGADGTLSRPSVIVFAAAGVLLSALMAMVFRNVYLIIRTSEGNTRFSKGATPFQPDVTRMLREIGYFTIAVPIVCLVMSVIARLAIGSDYDVETSVDLSYIVIGLLVLWLTQVFTRGEQLEQESEGLI